MAFLGVEDGDGGRAKIHVETKASLVGCPTCGVIARVKDRSAVELVDLALFERPTRLVWHKRRWMCPDGDCAMGSWTEEDDRIASPRQVLTSRAARWATTQIGRCARSVNEVATELGCDWHTVNDTVVAYGEALLEADTERIGAVDALGLDEVLMVRVGPYHRPHFSTQIVDVGAGQLLDVVPGRGSAEPMAWLAERTPAFLERIEFGTLDLSGPYRHVFEIMVPEATLVADPFHVVKLANTKLDECRRRVQNETLGHRGRKSDPLYRCRRLHQGQGATRREGTREARRPAPPVIPTATCATLWEAKEALQELYAHGDAEVALEWVTQLGHHSRTPTIRSRHALSDNAAALEAPDRRLAPRPCLKRNHRGGQQSHQAGQRAAFGFTSFRNYRIRSLLYAGKPNWDLLATVTPR